MSRSPTSPPPRPQEAEHQTTTPARSNRLLQRAPRLPPPPHTTSSPSEARDNNRQSIPDWNFSVALPGIENQIEKSWFLGFVSARASRRCACLRSEEHTSELQSRRDLVCRLLLEKKKRN